MGSLTPLPPKGLSALSDGVALAEAAVCAIRLQASHTFDWPAAYCDCFWIAGFAPSFSR